MDPTQKPLQTPKAKRSERSGTPTTPLRKLNIHTGGADTTLDAARDANLADLGHDIRQIPVKYFFKEYLPPVKEKLSLNAMLKELKKTGAITDDGWRDFSDRPKSRENVDEDICYSTVEKVVDAIVTVGNKLSGRDAWKLLCMPRTTPRGTERDSSCRPDCAIVLQVQESGSPLWDDIAVSGEFKKADKDTRELNKNTKQLAWDMNQTMRNDPSRRFTFGFTIENTTMRIWHADRSEVVTIKGFDFIDNYKRVIEFFARVMFAEPWELGWDPTMKRIVVDEVNQFDITVRTKDGEERIYRTVDLLSAVKAGALRGRATRVWKCVEVDKDGNHIGAYPVALKDTWIDEDRDREGSIIEQLRNSDDTKLRSILQRRLLTVECHGDVFINAQPDVTRRASSGSKDEHFVLKKKRANEEKDKAKAQVVRTAIASPYHSPDPEPAKIPPYHPKAHYRCVFKEVGEPLVSRTSLHDIFIALGQVARGLSAVHGSGWVHRDISSDNILIVDGEAKIADFEYAKRYTDQAVHNVRSGTCFFTAVEVARHDFAFRPPIKGEPVQRANNEAYDEYEDYQQDNAGSQRTGFELADSVDFAFNPMHDLESTWWVGADSVVNREVVQVGGKAPAPVTAERHEAHRAYAAALFYTDGARAAALVSPDEFRKKTQTCLPPSLAVAGKELASARDSLAAAYMHAEFDIASTDLFAAADRLYLDLQRRFFAVATACEAEDVQIAYHSTSTGTKRSNPTDINQGPSKKMRL